MFQERMEALYLDSSPLSDLSDLDGDWSSISGFSDQENFPVSANSPLPPTAGCKDLNSNLRNGGVSKRHRNPVRKVHQRNAANQRERKRMKIINDAFDGLRDRIPLECNERKLSKVDTLRLAIRYIQHLSDMVDSCGTGSVGQPNAANQAVTERIIIRCHNQGYPDMGEEDYHSEAYPPLYGHSLSWQDQNNPTPMPMPGSDCNRLQAKLWVPHMANAEDIAMLTEVSP